MKPKLEQRQPSPDDVWLAELNRGCALALANWLKQTVNVKRPICTLTIEELQCAAENVTARWVVLVSQRAKAHPESLAAETSLNLLMGG